MPIKPIAQNNTPSFKAIKFEDKYAKQNFLKTLKRQPLDEFNDCLNIIKSQEDNRINILIGLKIDNAKNDFNLKARVNYHTLEQKKSLSSFLKDCAKCADKLKVQYCNSLILSGEISETTVKESLYRNSLNNLSLTDLPQNIDYIN